MIVFEAPPGGDRIAAVAASRDAFEFLLGGFELAQRDLEQRVGADRQSLFEPELFLEDFAPEPERRAAARPELLLEIGRIGPDRASRRHRRIGEIAKQVDVVERGERQREILLDETQRAAHRLEAYLHEDAGRFLDVVAGVLDEARRLPELRQDAAGALLERRIFEQRLAGQARREEVRVELWVALPGPRGLELEETRLYAGLERGTLESVRSASGLPGRSPRGAGKTLTALEPACRRRGGSGPRGGRRGCEPRRTWRWSDAARADTLGILRRSAAGVPMST